jgi:hypothetical protein
MVESGLGTLTVARFSPHDGAFDLDLFLAGALEGE